MPLLRRRPFLRTVAETAVIAGAASVVGGRVRRHSGDQPEELGPAAHLVVDCGARSLAPMGKD